MKKPGGKWLHPYDLERKSNRLRALKNGKEVVACELSLATRALEFSRGGVRIHPTMAQMPNACFSGSTGSLEMDPSGFRKRQRRMP